jgi:hypothetical protein
LYVYISNNPTAKLLASKTDSKDFHIKKYPPTNMEGFELLSTKPSRFPHYPDKKEMRLESFAFDSVFFFSFDGNVCNPICYIKLLCSLESLLFSALSTPPQKHSVWEGGGRKLS